MEFEVARARAKGRLLTKYQRDRDWIRGMLTIAEERDNELHRVVRVARLRSVNQTDMLPPLHDVELIELREGWWTLTGYERLEASVPGDTACYQQSWFIVPLLAKDVTSRQADNCGDA